MPRLPLNDYATLLCETLREYDFPAVTCEFEPGGDEIVRKSCRGSMLIVERYIRGLLRSELRSQVKDGLSNVLYWGWAQTPLGPARVHNFRASPRHDLRAVDVERALFTLAGDTDGDDEAGRACVLLQGPAGWTFDC